MTQGNPFASLFQRPQQQQPAQQGGGYQGYGGGAYGGGYQPQQPRPQGQFGAGIYQQLGSMLHGQQGGGFRPFGGYQAGGGMPMPAQHVSSSPYGVGIYQQLGSMLGGGMRPSYPSPAQQAPAPSVPAQSPSPVSGPPAPTGLHSLTVEQGGGQYMAPGFVANGVQAARPPTDVNGFPLTGAQLAALAGTGLPGDPFTGGYTPTGGWNASNGGRSAADQAAAVAAYKQKYGDPSVTLQSVLGSTSNDTAQLDAARRSQQQWQDDIGRFQ